MVAEQSKALSQIQVGEYSRAQVRIPARDYNIDCPELEIIYLLWYHSLYVLTCMYRKAP